MADKEARLREKLRAAFPPRAHLTWVESHLTAQGVPDLNYEYRGCHGWVELKFMAEEDKEVEIRPAQYAWFRARVRAGGEPLMLVEMEDRGRSYYFLIRGASVNSPEALRTRRDVTGRAAFMSTDLPVIVEAMLGGLDAISEESFPLATLS